MHAVGAPLEIMVEDAAAPWSQADGTGYANDVVKAAFAAVGQEVTLLVVPYARCKRMVMEGRVAACFNMSTDPAFKNLVAFADKPIFQVHEKFYRNAGAPLRASSMSTMPPGAVVGIVNGYEYSQSVEALKQKAVVFVAADSETTNLKKLSLGLLDFALLMLDDIKTAEVLRQKAGVSNVKYAFDAESMGSYIGFSVKHPDGSRAREKYNQGYALIEKNGALQKLRVKWHFP